jgi:RHS repeat-associated protein
MVTKYDRYNRPSYWADGDVRVSLENDGVDALATAHYSECCFDDCYVFCNQGVPPDPLACTRNYGSLGGNCGGDILVKFQINHQVNNAYKDSMLIGCSTNWYRPEPTSKVIHFSYEMKYNVGQNELVLYAQDIDSYRTAGSQPYDCGYKWVSMPETQPWPEHGRAGFYVPSPPTPPMGFEDPKVTDGSGLGPLSCPIFGAPVTVAVAQREPTDPRYLYGNVFVHETDVSYTARIIPVELTRTYNSQDPANSFSRALDRTPTGAVVTNRWSSSWNTYVEPKDAYGLYHLRFGDGKRVAFYRVGIGTGVESYWSLSDDGGQLIVYAASQQASGFKWRYGYVSRDGNVFYFSTPQDEGFTNYPLYAQNKLTGLLTASMRRSGGTLRYPRTSAKYGMVDRIVDPAGNALVLDYDLGYFAANQATALWPMVRAITREGSSTPLVAYGYTNGMLSRTCYPNADETFPSTTDQWGDAWYTSGDCREYLYDADWRITEVRDSLGRATEKHDYAVTGTNERTITSYALEDGVAIGYERGVFSWDPVTQQYSTRVELVDDDGTVLSTKSYRYHHEYGLGQMDETEGTGGGGCPSCGETTEWEWLRKVASTDAAGATTTWEYPFNEHTTYDDRLLVKKRTEGIDAANPSGLRATDYTYNSEWGLLTGATTASSINAGGVQEVLTDWINSAEGINGIGNVQKTTVKGWTKDETGAVVQRQEVTQYTYDTGRKLLTVDGPQANDTVEYVYWPTGGPNSTLLWKRILHGPNGDQVTTYEDYTWFGKPQREIGPNGEVTLYQYDPRMRTKQVTRPDGSTLAYAYDTDANPVATTINGTATTSTAYDAAGNLRLMTDPLGNSIEYGYLDGPGFLERETTRDAQGTTTRLVRYLPDATYRQRAQVIASTPAGEVAETYIFDDAGRLERKTRPNGDYTRYTYDGLGRMLRTYEGQPGGFEWLSVEQVYRATFTETQRRSRDGLTVLISTTTEDDFGNVVSETVPETGTTQYRRNATTGLMTKKLLPDGTWHTYAYDGLGRVTSITPSNAPAEAIGYSYDSTAGNPYGLGKLTSMTDANGTTAYVHDAMGRVVSETRTEGARVVAIAYGYDLFGRLATLTYPSGRVVTYSYDLVGNVTGVSMTIGAVTTPLLTGATYAPFGPATSIALGNGVILNRTLDQRYLPSVMTAGIGGMTEALNRPYVWNGNGEVGEIQDLHDLSWNWYYTYTKGMLTNAMKDGEGSVAWGLDVSLGNRQTETHFTDAQAAYAYQPGTNRLLSITQGQAQTTFGYNAMGDITTYGSRTLAYNAHGRLVSVAEGGQTIAAYAYDGLSRRISKTTAAGTTRFVWDSSARLLEEQDAAGYWTKEYVWFGGEPLAMIVPAAEGETVSWFVNDHLGTPQALTDAGGDVVWRVRYEPYGAVLLDEDPDGDETPTVCNLRFPGQYEDAETGWSYNYFRYYAPELGRYLQADPVGINKGKNLPYQYVSNAPIDFVDSLGLYPGFCGNEDARWVPDRPLYAFNFEPACKAHDQCYGCLGEWQGKSRARCDVDFLGNMTKICLKYSRYSAGIWVQCQSLATTYFWAVRLGAGAAFASARADCGSECPLPEADPVPGAPGPDLWDPGPTPTPTPSAVCPSSSVW